MGKGINSVGVLETLEIHVFKHPPAKGVQKLAGDLSLSSKSSTELWYHCSFLRFSAEKKVWGQLLFTCTPQKTKGKNPF